MRSARFRFHGELNDFLPVGASAHSVDHEFELPRGVRDMIQAMGVPHVEVGAIEVNDSPVDFGHTIRDGDRIEVYPRFDRPARREMLHSPSVPHDFVIDVHLGKLARYLRLLGFDTLHEPDFDDETLASISRRGPRTLLTRDLQLLMRSQLIDATFVRSEDPRRQLIEVVHRLELRAEIKPFRRCMACNGLIEQVPKAEIEDQLPPTVKANYDRFVSCPGCGRVYWPGTHYDRLRSIVDEVRANPTG